MKVFLAKTWLYFLKFLSVYALILVFWMSFELIRINIVDVDSRYDICYNQETINHATAVKNSYWVEDDYIEKYAKLCSKDLTSANSVISAGVMSSWLKLSPIFIFLFLLQTFSRVIIGITSKSKEIASTPKN